MITYQDGRMINYIYSATGTKLSVTYTNGGSIKNNQYCGNMLYENGTLKQILIDGGYITFNGSTPQYHFYLKDHLGNNRVVLNAGGSIEQVNHYYSFGGLMGESTNGDVQTYKYNGKELDRMNGLDWYDYGARHMDGIRFTTIDPMAEKYYSISPYVYCADNPINRIDPDGRDWYQNNDNGYYTWYHGNEKREGYTYIGGKGSVLGEFEGIIDNILCGEEGLGLESLYSEGFTFDIAPNDKGGLIGSKERGWDFFDEFINGTGPEFSVMLDNHPYTEAIMNDDFAKISQNIVRSRGENGKYTNVARGEFFPWQASFDNPMQFIGTYRYDGYSSKNGRNINNVATDSKSITSLVYHIPFFKNHRRSLNKHLGTTYQFYIWRSKK